jgi:hypothetical protein
MKQNYRKTNPDCCLTCEHIWFNCYEHDGCEIFCNHDKLIDSMFYTWQIEEIIDWEDIHRVEEIGICDNFEKRAEDVE